MAYKYLLCVLTFILVACVSTEGEAVQPVETIQQEATATRVVATSKPLITATPNLPSTTVELEETRTLTVESEPEMATPTMLPTPTLLPDNYQPPLPDLMINLAENSVPLSFCYIAQPGQLWISQYPYTTASQLLSHEDNGYYYPIWSTDGNFMAYVSIDFKNSRRETQPNGEWTYYQDSVWIMDSNGANQQLISSSIERAEFSSTENDTCNVTMGIDSIIGWSFDSKWVAFTVLSGNLNEGLQLFVSNVETGDSFIVSNQLEDAFWHPNSNRLIVTTNTLKPTIKLITINGLSNESISIDSPSNFPPDYVSIQSQLDFENEGLFVVVVDTSFYNAPASLWHVGITEQIWTEIKEVDLNSKHGIRLDISGQFPLLCTRKDGMNSIEAFNPFKWESLREINLENMSCQISRLFDNNQNEMVSFSSIVDRRSIWVSLSNGNNPTSQEIIQGDLIGFPSDYEIAFYSWRTILPKNN
jgi:hypothetical protein